MAVLTDVQIENQLKQAFMPDFVVYPHASADIAQRQCALLVRVAQTGVLLHSCLDLGIALATAQSWQSRDVYGFRERLDIARQVFSESLEGIAFDRVRLQTPGANPMLLLRLLEAHLAEKYKTGQHLEPGDALEFLARLKALGKGISTLHNGHGSQSLPISGKLPALAPNKVREGQPSADAQAGAPSV